MSGEPLVINLIQKEVLKMNNMQMSIQEMLAEKAKARAVAMQPYANNPVLIKEIPEIAKGVFEEEFGITVRIPEAFPLAFMFGWEGITRYAQEQPTPEFAITIAGVTLEYVTDLSESDKARNIVPQLIHKDDPIFKSNNHVDSIGVKSNADMIENYERWRTENLTETVTKVENEVYKTLLNDYGIDLCVTNAIIPMMAVTYTAGLAVARKTRQTVNMYNIFQIDIADGDVVLLTPLADIKYRIKCDDKH